MTHKHLEGRRYVNLVRCSTDQQADTSPEDQQKILNLFARDQGMLHAGGDEKLEGVSGSIPNFREDIDRLVTRKLEKDDFDILLIQDVSRLTRRGMDHIGSLKTSLGDVGVDVVFATQGTSGDPDQDSLIQGIAAFGAQQHVKGISYAIVRGQTSSLEAGKIPHSFRIVYGVDRLYVGPDGKGRHRIRNLADGSQQMLALDSDTVLAQYPPNPKKGECVHYRRQSDERIELIPGAADRVAVVQQIYRRSLVEGIGHYRIAQELNDAGTLSAEGRGWNSRSVKVILANPTYTGLGIASQYAKGIYHMRGTDAAPMPVPRVKGIGKLKQMPNRLRPSSEWKKIAYPHLVNFLGDNLAPLAADHHVAVIAEKAIAASAPAKKKKPGGDKHADSPYLLKQLLHSLQGDFPMTGKTTGTKAGPRRYYSVTHAFAVPYSGATLARLIPAEPLERAVLSAIRQTLLDVPYLHEVITRQLKRQQDVVPLDEEGVKALMTARDEVVERLKDGMKLGASSRKLMANEFELWETQLAQLEAKIAAIRPMQTLAPINVNAVATAVTAQMSRLADSLDSLSPETLRQLLRKLVSKLVVNLETKEVEMELALPEGVPHVVGADGKCLVGRSSKSPSNEAQRLVGLKLAIFDCNDVEPERFKPSCFVCSRRAA